VLLELENVSKGYDAPAGGERSLVLRGLSLRLGEREAVAIVGPSGSGKSTLLHLMGGLDRPTSGSVRLSGRDLARLGDEDLARVRNEEIGFVFQSHHLLPQCTAWENVLVPTLVRGSTPEARARARSLLERVGLGARLHHRPGELSGGECQRVAVARALIQRPRLVLADEPTGSLDRAAAAELGRLLAEANVEEGAALVVVTHSEELARRMGRVLRLADGVLTEAGGGA